MPIELFVKIICYYIVISGIIKFILPKTNIKYDRKSPMNYLFGSTTINTWRMFYLALLWLCLTDGMVFIKGL